MGLIRSEQRFSSDAWQGPDAQIALEGMLACMLNLLGLFHATEEITLMFDRVDKC